MDELIAAGRRIGGYTSYDVQSTEAALDGYGVGLNYGAVEGPASAALAFGHEVVDALARHGLRTVWTGN